MEQQGLYEGERINICGKQYIVPALSLGQLEQHTEVIARLSNKKNQQFSPQMMQDVVTIIHSAMSRNYPDITVDELKNMIDARNLAKFIAAVMYASGLVEYTGSGETEPVG